MFEIYVIKRSPTFYLGQISFPAFLCSFHVLGCLECLSVGALKLHEIEVEYFKEILGYHVGVFWDVLSPRGFVGRYQHFGEI
jgi:hypothetical protein